MWNDGQKRLLRPAEVRVLCRFETEFRECPADEASSALSVDGKPYDILDKFEGNSELMDAMGDIWDSELFNQGGWGISLTWSHIRNLQA